ncbi:TetR/AcrR family transcriptional regulator [Pseudalkalibacillus decolorationis]|uniref:TetR/AcrR family transcriptional regulator n=1 Tax=Pseudalkalibacillus decolorationis TaxID=163879 RepID=UPI002147DA3E|nr:TetR/AcrR family transcriptional regulator [Pseudalkalibacillus decolorationis]
MKKQQPSTRKQRSMQTREKLLDAAQDIFSEFGFQKTTVTQIIKKASTGYGTAYVHFSNKDEIFIELMEGVMQRFYEIAEQSFQPNTVEQASHLIQKQVHLFLEMADQEKKMMKVIEEAIGLSEEVRRKWSEIRERFIQGIAEDIDYAQKSNLARKDVNNELVARGWFYSNEMYLWEIVRGENQASVEEIVHNLSAMYTHGLYN